MLSNFHTHSTFCDGNDTPEDMAKAAFEEGFDALGFSSHGYTRFDLSYCVKDEDGYVRSVSALKQAYKGKMEIYLGTEEDAFALIDRSKYEYIIGSLHFLKIDGKILPIDIGNEYMQRCFEAFDKNAERMAECYYSTFTDYLMKRRPDVVGHFDLIKKYDEVSEPIFLGNKKHDEIAKSFLRTIASKGFLFEVNTGAIARGYRTLPYPSADLLHVLKAEGADITITSDCHNADYLDCYFDETKHILYDIGFRKTVILCNNKFTKIPLK